MTALSESDKAAAYLAKVGDDTHDPVAIAHMAMAAGEPGMTATLIADRATVAQARDRLDVAGKTMALFALSKGMGGITPQLMADIRNANLTVAETTDRLLTAMAEADMAVPVSNARRTGNGVLDGRTLSRNNMLQQARKAGLLPKE